MILQIQRLYLFSKLVYLGWEGLNLLFKVFYPAITIPYSDLSLNVLFLQFIDSLLLFFDSVPQLSIDLNRVARLRNCIFLKLEFGLVFSILQLLYLCLQFEHHILKLLFFLFRLFELNLQFFLRFCLFSMFDLQLINLLTHTEHTCLVWILNFEQVYIIWLSRILKLLAMMIF